MLRKFCILIFIFFVFSNFTFAAKKQTFQELTAEILESLQSFNPVQSTGKGIHAYDHRFADYSSKSVKAMLKSLNNYEKKLYKKKSTKIIALDPDSEKILEKTYLKFTKKNYYINKDISKKAEEKSMEFANSLAEKNHIYQKYIRLHPVFFKINISINTIK